MQQTAATQTSPMWLSNSTADIPMTFTSEYSRPGPPALSVGPHFTPKKRGRPPKSAPFLDLDFGGSSPSDKTSSGSPINGSCSGNFIGPVKKTCSTTTTATATGLPSPSSLDTADRKDRVYSTSTSTSLTPTTLLGKKSSSTSSSSIDPLEDTKTDDVFIGAYLLSQLSNRSIPTCVNCHTRRTPLWRKGWRDGILKRDVLLCNACGLKYSKRQYCCYCKFIYNMKEDVLSQQSNWMDCDSCRRWVHIDCELRFGNTFTFDGRKYHGPAKYFCPDCQHEQKQQQLQQQQQLQSQNMLLPKPQQQQHMLTTPSATTTTTTTGNHPVSFAQGQAITLPLPMPLAQQQRPQLPQLQPQPFSPPRLPLPSLLFPPPSPTNPSGSSLPILLPSFDRLNPTTTPQGPNVFFNSSPFSPLNIHGLTNNNKPSTNMLNRSNFVSAPNSNNPEPMTF